MCDSVPEASSELSGCVESPRAARSDVGAALVSVTCPPLVCVFHFLAGYDLCDCQTSLKLMSTMKLKQSWMMTKDAILFHADAPARLCCSEHTHHRNPSIIASEHNGREWVEREESWESGASGWVNYPTGRCFFLMHLPFSATPPCVMWRSEVDKETGK